MQQQQIYKLRSAWQSSSARRTERTFGNSSVIYHIIYLIFQSCQMLPDIEDSFYVLQKPMFASKNSFCSIFRDLQDSHTFAPLHTQNFNKISSISLKFFHDFSNFAICFAERHLFCLGFLF